jgi:WD40 repeat protein
LYETFTGRPPFQADSILETIEKVLHEEPVPLHRLQPHLPRDLATICHKCLQKEPYKRYGSTLELADDLRSFLDGRPIQARPSSAWERAVKWARRRPAVAALAASSTVTTLALLVVAAFYTLALRDSNMRLRDALQEVQGRRIEAIQQQRRAEEERDKARRALYLRDVELAGTALDQEQVRRTLKLLEVHRPTPGQQDLRGFEWHYLWKLCHRERVVFNDGQDFIEQLRFATDGRALASLDFRGSLRLWDPVTGKGLPSPIPVGERVGALAFAPDGRTLAAGGEDGSVRLWDRTSGRLDTTIPMHQSAVRALAFSPDGRTLAMGGDDGVPRFWDLIGRREKSSWPKQPGTISSLLFARDAKTLAITYESRHIAELWDVDTGRIRAGLDALAGSVMTEVCLHPDGTCFVTAEAYPFDQLRAGRVRLRDLATLKDRWNPLEVPGGAFAVGFSPDGEILAVGSNAGTVTLQDMRTGQLRNTFYGHTQRVRELAFSPDGQLLASGGNDSTVRLWDATAGPSPVTLQAHRGPVNCVAFTPDGRTLATGGHDGAVRLWDAKTWRLRRPILVRGGHVHGLALSPDGRSLATGGDEGVIRLWDVATTREIGTLPGHTAKITSVAFAPDGRTLASSGFDGTVRLWDVAAREQRLALKGHTNPEVWFTAFSPDGRTLASASQDETVILWNPASGTLRATLHGYSAGLMSVAFSPDGSKVAAGAWAALIQGFKVWDVETGATLAKLEGHNGSVIPVLFTPDGTTLISGSTDGTVKFWDVATWQERFTLKGHENTVGALALTKDGSLLASGCNDGKIKIWDAGLGDPSRLEITSVTSHTPAPDR